MLFSKLYYCDYIKTFTTYEKLLCHFSVNYIKIIIYAPKHEEWHQQY